jgi:DNA repair photolyase
MVLEFTAVFAFKLVDKVNRKRIEKVKELNKRLVELNKQYVNDYLSLYDNMRELKKENEELKKQLDKQGIVTYNYYINK